LEAGSAVLFEIVSESGSRSQHPFDVRVETATIIRYTEVWQRAVLYIYRTQVFLEDPRIQEKFTLWKMTPHQEDLWQLIIRAAGEQLYDTLEGDDRTALNRLVLNFLISLLDHQLPGRPYESPLLSALAGMGVDLVHDVWVAPVMYTNKYSAILRVAKYLVLYQSQLETEENPTQGDGKPAPYTYYAPAE